MRNIYRCSWRIIHKLLQNYDKAVTWENAINQRRKECSLSTLGDCKLTFLFKFIVNLYYIASSLIEINNLFFYISIVFSLFHDHSFAKTFEKNKNKFIDYLLLLLSEYTSSCQPKLFSHSSIKFIYNAYAKIQVTANPLPPPGLTRNNSNSSK